MAGSRCGDRKTRHAGAALSNETSSRLHRNPSLEDRFSKVLTKLEDYFAWGVPFCWIVDQVKQKAWSVEPDGRPNEVPADGLLQVGEIEIGLSGIFSDEIPVPR